MSTELARTLLAWTGQGQPVALATIISNKGSAPRTAGARMAVHPGGAVHGSVGGGLLEARVLEAASTVMHGGPSALLDMELSGDLAAGADMVCGGKVTVFVRRVSPGPEADVFARLLERLESGLACILASPLSGGPGLLVDPEEDIPGQLAGLLPSALACGPAHALTSGPTSGPAPGRQFLAGPETIESGGQAWLLEPWRRAPALYIAGAGHVGLATARVASLAGFRVIVMDDRLEFANAERFPFAAETVVVPLESCLQGRLIGEDASIVIVTRGHAHDAQVLAQALGTKAGYVGMIGSLRKREAVYAGLRGQGFEDARLERVRCPIGLPIGASTPEEIAVSIVAELILHGAGRGTGPGAGRGAERAASLASGAGTGRAGQ